MKAGTILIVFWMCIANANAQQIIEKHISFSGKNSVSLDIQIADTINVQTWNKSEVYIKGSVNINNNKDNAAYKTTFTEEGNTAGLDARFDNSYFKGKKNCCTESEISWTVFMPENAALSVETIDGNITITGKPGRMKVKSISGYIDLAISPDRAANLGLSTISGTMYSDLDLKPDRHDSNIPMKISQKLNNGGETIDLETISGDIFVRKSK